MGTFNYYNVTKNTTSSKERNLRSLKPLEKPIETWAVAKRNASSYIFDLSESDQSTWENNLHSLEVEQYDRFHDLEIHTGIDRVAAEDKGGIPSAISTSDLKFCIRDPLHRYISALGMVEYDPHGYSMREMTMPRSYQAGGRLELEQNYNLKEYRGSGIAPPQMRQMYMWSQFLKHLSTTTHSQNHSFKMCDYTFGECHLDPALSITALVPFVEPEATISLVDIWNWTEYTTGILGIPLANSSLGEEHEIVDKWAGRKKEGTVGKAQTIGKIMFSMLKKELPWHYIKTQRAVENPQNWRQNFDDWLKPEVELYEFFKANPVIAPNSVAKQELMELLIEQLKDPYFILRHPEVDVTFSNKDVRKKLPHELQVAISEAIHNSRNWLENWRRLT